MTIPHYSPAAARELRESPAEAQAGHAGAVHTPQEITARRAGRPRTGGQACSVSLTPDEQAFFRALGGGSLTAGLREAYRRLAGAPDAAAAPSVSPSP